jgi:hypothetical protein
VILKYHWILGFLENMLYIRGYTSRNNICCNGFQPTAAMFTRFTSDIYKANASELATTSAEANNDDELFMLDELC